MFNLVSSDFLSNIHYPLTFPTTLQLNTITTIMSEVLPRPPPEDRLNTTGKALLEELRKIAESNPDGVIDAIKDAAENNESRQFMEAEMKRLSDTVMFIKGKFESVKGTLRLFDSKKFRKLKEDGSAGGDYIDKLEPQWDVFRLVRRQLTFHLRHL